MGKVKAAAVEAGTSSVVDPVLIVFGRDEAGKAHASWFGAADAELAEKAAGAMAMRALRVTTPEHRAAALGLAAGRVFASGKGFVPFTKEAAYEALSAFEGAFDPPPPVAIEPEPPLTFTSVPASWTDIDVGALVLASEDVGEPWYEAVVTEAKGENLFVLRWKGWPDEPSIVRLGSALALLPAAVTALVDA